MATLPRSLCHPFGHRIGKALVSRRDVKQVAAFLETMEPHLHVLLFDQHANFVLQSALLRVSTASADRFLDFLQKRYVLVTLAMHRHASHVVEVLLLQTGDVTFNNMLRQLVRGIDDLLQHAYGNYVIQRALHSVRTPAQLQVLSFLASVLGF